MAAQFGRFMMGAIVGGAVGAAIGMLLAPRSGSETRAMIREEYETRKQQSGDAIRERSDMLREKATAFRGKLQDMSTELEEVGRKTVDKVKTLAATTEESTSS